MNTSTDANEPILWTKLHRPQLDKHLVNRDRLIESMNRVLELPLTLVSAPAGYGKSVLAAQLLNDLGTIDRPCVIVFDDYHRIETLSHVHDLVLRVLEHPPRQVHFVVLTRQDPPFDLLKLRAGHGINEVRLQDLSFTETETKEFLINMVNLSVSDEALTQLHREVEGWVVGLRLVSLALRNVHDADVFLKKVARAFT